MFKRWSSMNETFKAIITAAGVASAILSFAWKAGARLSTVDAGLAEVQTFKKEQIERNRIVDEKVTRVETMVEMVVRGMGMRPPARGERAR